MDKDRYSNYRTIEAKFGCIGACDHAIKKGDRIGYNPTTKKARCPACWEKWKSENAEADFDEKFLSY
jgi:hypothetical protein